MATSAEGTAEVGHEAGHLAFPPFDTHSFPSQILWFAIIFGALYYYMSRRVLPGVGEVIANRRARIARDIDEATEMHRQADARVADQEKGIAAARRDAQATAQAARDRVTAEAEAKRKTLDDQLNTRLAEAEKRIAANRNAAMGSVAGIAREATNAIVERLIGRAPNEAAVSSAVDASGSR